MSIFSLKHYQTSSVMTTYLSKHRRYLKYLRKPRKFLKYFSYPNEKVQNNEIKRHSHIIKNHFKKSPNIII